MKVNNLSIAFISLLKTSQRIYSKGVLIAFDCSLLINIFKETGIL